MHKLNVLIVEDESLLALELATKIGQYNFNVVDYVTDVNSASLILQNNTIDLLIMDINLNNTIDGIEFYKTLAVSPMLIYISAYTDEKTLNRAVTTQPLGYLVKPFNEKELLALLKLAEFTYNSKNCLYTLPNNFSFDMKNNTLFYGTNHINISGKKLKLLKLLIEANGNYIPFNELERELYPDTPPSESSLRTLIYRLRKELKDDMIETERTYGIRLKMTN
ncbi:response regulator transcription factor [Sulfurimonas sp.]|uniref:response regulator transcription factor n=1 Tax=Sulfurimonas sp. TaxID=2022749 RepID=UPI003D102016